MPDIVRKTSRTGKGRGRNVMGTLSTSRDYRPKDGEGPNTPLFTPKMRQCRTCGEHTVNYFKCPACIYNVEKNYTVDESAWGFSG